MAKAKKRTSSRSVRKSAGKFRFSVRSLVFAAVLLLGLVVSVVAALRNTEYRNFAACNDSGCQNIRNGSYYMLINCAVYCDPDGDQQICNAAGRVGMCGGNLYCCPAAGALWTRDMTACAGKTYTDPCATSTPPPTSTVRPTNTPIPTSPPAQATYTPYPTYTPYVPNPTATNRPVPTATRRPLPTATRRPTSTPIPSKTLTPSPTPLLSAICGKACVTDTDCSLGLTCTTVFTSLKACRQPNCPDKPGCVCDGTGGIFDFVTPTAGPGPSGDTRTIAITLGKFTDGKNQTNTQPTISGTTEPEAKVSVTVYPDGIGGEVYADKNGKWSFRPTSKLSPGTKNLVVIATKDTGQGQVSQPFTVVGGGKGINFGTIILIMVVIAIAFGAYVYIKSNQ